MLRRRIFFCSLSFIMLALLGVAAAYNLDCLLSRSPDLCSIHPSVIIAGVIADARATKLAGLFVIGAGLIVVGFVLTRVYVDYHPTMQEVVPDINLPQPEGQGQYGTARWLHTKEYGTVFARSEKNYYETRKGGLILGMEKQTGRLYYLDMDTHTLVIGSTGSGKSRNIVIPSIGLLAIAGESMIVADLKGDLSAYTQEFLASLGHEVIILDFLNPNRSTRYNFLQPVIDAINSDDAALAIQHAWDIVTSLVASDHANERIWTDGTQAVIAAAILAVVYDNRDKPYLQNLTNVYHFVAQMCKPTGKYGRMPLEKYMADIKNTSHPCNGLFDISSIAPSKMRGSFDTGALVTLRLFTDPNIYDMTCQTDWDIYATGDKKRAIFIVLPDHKSTYYGLASLFIYQHYQTLVDVANARGNVLARRVNYILDEFGNLPEIPDMDTLITVGRSRGIRFNLFLQDFNQIDETYGEKKGKTIRSNCKYWVYLNTNDHDTLKEFAEKLGPATVKSPSLSGSSDGNTSASYNYTDRELMKPDEIRLIDRPYQLVITKTRPAIMYAPDVSKTAFNEYFGMGDEEHNRKLIMQRQAARQSRPKLRIDQIPLWGLWDKYSKLIQEEDKLLEALMQKKKADATAAGAETAGIETTDI